MPRIPSISERTPLNLWDSFNPREIRDHGSQPSLLGYEISLRLFGNRNVGVLTRTNLQVAGHVERDAKYAITNWYARTNIHALPAEFHAFASSTVVTLAVGQRPRRTIPLADLLQRTEGQVDVKTHGEEREASDALAQNMYAEVSPEEGVVGAHWHQLPQFEQDHWRRISRVAHGMVSPPIVALIPERQNYDVTITADRRALGRLLEVMPADVAPESLVWVHLEGVRRTVRQ